METSEEGKNLAGLHGPSGVDEDLRLHSMSDHAKG